MTGSLQTLLIWTAVNPPTLAKLEKAFPKVLYRPDQKLPSPAELREVDVWLTDPHGIPNSVTLDQIPNTRIVQLASAGANLGMSSPMFKDDDAKKQIALCTSSGMHVFSVPQMAIAFTLNIYSVIHLQTYLARRDRRWYTAATGDKVIPGYDAPHLPLYGKTVGFLGYGHIAREAARLFKAFNCHIIAANTTGTKKDDTGYIIAGTGDPDGSIPEAYYSTEDAKSLKEFLARSDVVIASLPSTPATHYVLSPEYLSCMPEGSVLVNVGRGDLARSEDIIAALDAPGGLRWAALDVTDPEPLPDNHPLYSHPKVLLTPHTGGHQADYMDGVSYILLEQLKRSQEKRSFVNAVDWTKGY